MSADRPVRETETTLFGVSVAKAIATPPAAVPALRPAAARRRRSLSLLELTAGVRAADRSILGRAISLIESQNAHHRKLARALLDNLLPHTGNSWRVGITGVPGAGKSTFIEALGSLLTSQGQRVAVLAVDPSSGVTGGSILGDKTRMHKLSVDPNAFIRPSPSSGTLGGVAQCTRETMLLCEAAGFDVVLIETVGVGQSETVVAGMTDYFLALMVAGAGDELQGIKRGLIELVDMIVINKADGDNVVRAKQSAQHYANAVHMLARSSESAGPTPVLTCSSLSGVGISDVWDKIQARCEQERNSGALQRKRSGQALAWLKSLVDNALLERFYALPAVMAALPQVEQLVLSGELSATTAAENLLESGMPTLLR